jgi:hypothetical protein
MNQPVSGGSDELRIRLDDKYGVSKRYRSGSPQSNHRADSLAPVQLQSGPDDDEFVGIGLAD